VAKLEALRALLQASDSVLEIGCGTGTTALKLAPLVAQYTATDISRSMIEIAEEKKLVADAGNLRFAISDAASRSPGAPFDAILSFSLLHLVEDLSEVLRNVHYQLRPGGVFISKTVCLGEANLAIRGLVRVLGAIGVAPPVTYLTKDELIEAIRAAGFQVETCTYFGPGKINPFIVARRKS
jgi:SAM-dependent methyltransferase